IMQCDYDAESAQVANIRLFVAIEDAGAARAFPDGSIVDREGCLWNAQWGAGRVVRYSPDGRSLHSLQLAAKNPTCPAFGGIALGQLMTTSSRLEMTNEDLKQQPHAGGLFMHTIQANLGVCDALFDDLTPAQ
ncbi:MAG: SMP-30/gluconolactonase/LRE family protein, partial [Burkholderiaceae bacterium]|nr:SMP-30/gluconolactonase/LRE family protein [Burkholderiaceae bacterium]